jgi:hypothetical protein
MRFTVIGSRDAWRRSSAAPPVNNSPSILAEQEESSIDKEANIRAKVLIKIVFICN